jgi:large subunit ribosomal protein L15
MDLSTITERPGGRKNRKRVGRGHGSGSGKTSGRGHKGQKARSGYSRKRGFEGGQMPLNRRLPKRGFKYQDRFPMAAVNLDTLEAVFEAGAEVNAQKLIAAGAAKETRGGVKILGRGEVTKALKLTVNAISAQAKTKIEAAGGSVTVLGPGAKQESDKPAPKTESAGEAGEA